MSSRYRLQLELESALLQAFPQLPKPSLDWKADTAVAQEAQKLIREHTWLESVGFKLRREDLDSCLTVLTNALPAEVVAYLVPSHLMLASLALGFGAETDYPGDVMEAFLLPSGNSTVDATLEKELCVGPALAWNPDRGTKIYHALNRAQRACVATFLELYLLQAESEVSERAKPHYLANLEYWRGASYAVVK